MSYNTFSLAIKSTLDFTAKRLADSKALAFVDLSAAEFSPEVMESDKPAVVWEFATLSEDPRDPLWLCTFDIGIMTFLDPSQYLSLDLISMFLDAFKAGSTFQIFDYSGDVAPTQTVGSMYVIASGVSPHQADSATGLRFVTVTARAIRHV